MRTGEGKTLVAVLPAVLNALTGEGVQVRCSALHTSTAHQSCTMNCSAFMLPVMPEDPIQSV